MVLASGTERLTDALVTFVTDRLDDPALRRRLAEEIAAEETGEE